ncbi:MAG: YvcK family protein [Opitutae bacterium]|nr:YvcK family protein [Opitutae bacterium]
MSISSRASWTGARSSLEHKLEGVLSRLSEDPRAAGKAPSQARVVVLGGGTGLSTVLGGNASLASWPDRTPAGLAREFQQVHVGVCTTDDGGSTGELVRRLPMIGIGDLRKVLLSMIDRETLAGRHGRDVPALKIVQRVFLHRFGARAPSRAALRDPVRVLEPALRKACPPALRAALAGLTAGMGGGLEVRLRVPGHCLGNLLLTAAVFRGMRKPGRAPSMAEVNAGLSAVAAAIGAPPGRVFAATASPGTLIYEYANGVVATGQSRAAKARRGCAVRRVRISFASAPQADPQLIRRLREADLIVYAPGSLYSSMLPLLLTPGVVEAIRGNRRAVKILGANLWIQEGETDMSFREESRGFWVSELIEAYGRNVPGGIAGLFDAVLATSLDTVPGSIIRNYALEDKHPIHLDRARVTALGVVPVEASLFSNDRWQRDSMIHHDPARFAAAVRTLSEGLSARGRRGARKVRTGGAASRGGPLILSGPSACARMEAVGAALSQKVIRPAALRRAVEDFLWEHPDVRPEHLACFDGVQAVPEAQWKRSREWDNVLGYYEPDTRQIMLHAQALRQPATLKANFAVALGESLLGRYIARKRWQEDPRGGCRVYEIELRPPALRDCFLPDASLRTYLRAAQMLPRAGEPLRHWRPVAKGMGFLPCGILFGLMFAWVLDNAHVPALEFEMQMLQWPASRLLPYQVKARARHRELVRFFREEVFQNG